METEDRYKEIESLKAAIEEAAELKVETPKQFINLHQFILKRTGEYLSVTTLKRIWGYLNEPLITRTTTLSILAKAIGFKDWEDFQKRNDPYPTETEIASTEKFGKSIDVVKDLKKGDELILYWYPGRECHVLYLGNMEFEVVSSKNTRLLPGYRFHCHLILSGHPLYLSGVTDGKMEPRAYICGKLHGGVQFERL